MKSIKLSYKELINSDNRIFGFDLLRFLAIFYVFWGHGAILIPNEFKSIYSWATFIPIEGVSVFFVLSGFLIGNILIRTIKKTEFNPKELLNFWSRRWYRTIPNYFVVLIILLIVNARAENFDLRYLFFSQSLIGKHPDFYTVSWSLAVEEWFYFLFPLVLMVVLFVRKKNNSALLICIGLFIIIPFVLRYFHFIDNEFLPDANIRKTTVFRFDSMMFGIFSAFLYSYYNRFWLKQTKLFTFLGVLSLVVIILLKKYWMWMQYPIFEAVYVYYFEAIPVFFFLPFLSALKDFRFTKLKRFIVFISKMSYSIYLVHGSLVLWFILRKLREVESFLEIRFEVQRLILYVLYVVLTILISFLLYVFVEKPVMNFRDRITKHY
jgi:peptidoglycan/LPS O-acetylase OafA/YrhL